MTRSIVTMLLLALGACSKDQGLATIEDAEAFAKARGVVLTEKTEHKEQIVAPRSYGYRANGTVDLDITQFASPEAAGKWKTLMNDLPLGSATRIQKGPLVLSVWGATDAERQKVISALQQ